MGKYTWDYNPPGGSSYQIDWNQTLVTVLNMIYVENGFESECILVKCPVKFEPIFDSLFYYNIKKQLLSDKYFIEYRDNDSNIINVDGFELEILNFKEKI